MYLKDAHGVLEVHQGHMRALAALMPGYGPSRAPHLRRAMSAFWKVRGPALPAMTISADRPLPASGLDDYGDVMNNKFSGFKNEKTLGETDRDNDHEGQAC